MYDLDIARVINSFEGITDRIFFVVNESPSRTLLKKLDGFGRVLSIGVDGFAAAVADILLQPEVETTSDPIAWERIDTPTVPSAPLRDIDVINYLMSGSVDESLLATDILRNQHDLSINREISNYISDAIIDKRFRNALVSANVGNGKTEALLAIGYKLAARGHTVYRASSRPSLLLKEVALLRDKPGPIALMIDDVFSYIDVVKGIRSISRDDICIIASSRTAQVELQEAFIRATFNNEIDIFNLDKLSAAETRNVIELFDNYALWGPRQPQSFEQKKIFIDRECSGELRFLILEALNSPNIRSRVEQIMNVNGSTADQERVRKVLILSQLLNLAQIRSDLSLISEIVGFDARKAIADHAGSLKDFALIRNGQISIKSPIFSEYVIKRLLDTSFVISTMIDAMRQLDDIHDNSSEYQLVYRNFSRYIFVEQAIAADKRLKFMVHYFENIKELSHSRTHPLFWLQYAMCRMSLEQWGEAKRLFDVSYSFSKSLGHKENRHQNNQWARFLLESRTKSNEFTDFAKSFNEAHSICVKQMIDEPSSYAPYRVAKGYLPFLERRLLEFSTGELLGIIRSASEIIRQYNTNGKKIGHDAVERCVECMTNTIKMAKKRLAERGVAI
ncbi:P-loop NTPase [Lichenifustis flavocetrariae]|uniref:Novel STAND NTPase 5 domain-containing protein n=1 Tax=Lichenifustis flavocetrariae TaxID=2949735 RepID=A0AA41Z2M2_9HYPH|nr:hypothetical protein [Lichenifustis flavocetrariae]MCW6509220.1 hypothetical protein [Lichenifustis flavocetrariae]